jgi:N-acetylglucosaminyldiphosphoundecaprenol N-acetyl-beta-D-mannosaminyltransferase
MNAVGQQKVRGDEQRLKSPVLVGGVRVDPICQDDLHDLIMDAALNQHQRIVLNANARAIALAQSMPDFRAALNAADVVFCDGYGVLLAARFLGARLPQRITYADWIDPFADFSARQGLSWYFLGAAPGVAEAAAERLRARHPNLRILGTHHGYYDLWGAENEPVIAQINALKPDVTFVGFGMPTQELWIQRFASRLETHVLLSAGACFDYASGRLRRGPRWMTDHGLEWLARILIEPRRLLRRYVVDLAGFARAVLAQKLFGAGRER